VNAWRRLVRLLLGRYLDSVDQARAANREADARLDDAKTRTSDPSIRRLSAWLIAQGTENHFQQRLWGEP